MTAFDAGRESWEAAAPRPWLLVVRRLIAMVLGVVCGVEFALLLWVLS